MKNAVLLQQDEMKSKKREKTNVLACTSCFLTADKTHPNKLLISPTLSKQNVLMEMPTKTKSVLFLFQFITVTEWCLMDTEGVSRKKSVF